jgi:hypothetical protein
VKNRANVQSQEGEKWQNPPPHRKERPKSFFITLRFVNNNLQQTCPIDVVVVALEWEVQWDDDLLLFQNDLQALLAHRALQEEWETLLVIETELHQEPQQALQLVLAQLLHQKLCLQLNRAQCQQEHQLLTLHQLLKVDQPQHLLQEVLILQERLILTLHLDNKDT